jgi:hypothetical protein
VRDEQLANSNWQFAQLEPPSEPFVLLSCPVPLWLS